MRSAMLGVVCVLAAACGSHESPQEEVRPEQAAHAAQGEVVTPPFGVRGDLTGLLLVWFDEHGTHTATKRDDIPAAHRDAVRVDSLRVEPDDRLDADDVYVADVRQPAAGGSYVVRRMSRESFDARALAVELAAEEAQAQQAAQQQAQQQLAQLDPHQGQGAAPPPGQGTAHAGDADVIIYGASWCGACHAAQAYLRQRGVPFVEKDIEREPGAQQEMVAKASRAGLRPTGIPVIDFRGHILLGFDQRALDQLISAGGNGASPPGQPI